MYLIISGARGEGREREGRGSILISSLLTVGIKRYYLLKCMINGGVTNIIIPRAKSQGRKLMHIYTYKDRKRDTDREKMNR